MKLEEGLKIINSGWIRKPKGFRVRCDKRTENGIEVVYSPPLDDTPLNSDVTAWRYAWKLWQATRAEAEADHPGALFNIVVVDDRDQLVRFYVTGELVVYNPKRFDGSIDPDSSSDETRGKRVEITDS
ncbi:MAG: hypothetical protein HGJ93_17785 [Desulfosarcina sp.]|nr:hypothetical protein [Desulfosarcina sp.]MBC2767733.1 hypothetical protein [Desulfosarcina sp.]